MKKIKNLDTVERERERERELQFKPTKEKQSKSERNLLSAYSICK